MTFVVNLILRMTRIIAITFLLAAALLAPAQEKTQRLILKDGTYQVATKWEFNGDRVRYYSAERYEWEELPRSLVDWDATEKFNTEQAKPVPATEEEIADRPVYASPGVRLPDTGGVQLLDTVDGKPRLTELNQSNGELNRQTGRNVLRSIINPIPTSVKQTVELHGARAQVRTSATQPVIFLNVDYGESDAAAKTAPSVPPDLRFRIVRLRAGKDARTVSDLRISLRGNIKEKQNTVECVTEVLTSGWLKLTPRAPLAPGEYAVAEMLTPDQANIYVWDFGVDAADAKP